MKTPLCLCRFLVKICHINYEYGSNNSPSLIKERINIPGLYLKHSLNLFLYALWHAYGNSLLLISTVLKYISFQKYCANLSSVTQGPGDCQTSQVNILFKEFIFGPKQFTIIANTF